ncbi:MAG: glycosyltransferase [Candidatus Methanofastidiosia archaeon]
MKTAIIIPMYNEEKNVFSLITRIEDALRKNDLNVDVFLINDGSTDSTLDEIRKVCEFYENIKVISYQKNKGFGKALRIGIENGIKKRYDVMLFMDGDETHDPLKIPNFLQEIRKGFDFVVGSRYVKGGGMEDVPFLRVFVSKVGNLFMRNLLKLPVKDVTTGYRAIRREIIEKLILEEDGFPIQLEEVVKARRLGCRFSEIPIKLKSRKRGTSKFNLSLKVILKYLLMTMKLRSMR